MAELIAASAKPNMELRQTPNGQFVVLLKAKDDMVRTAIVLEPKDLVNLYKFLHTVNELYPLRYLADGE